MSLQGCGHHHRGGHGGDVGVKQVSAHAGHVAHVVAHVVGDDGGVARVILGDAQLHLSGQVGRHVGGLGEDAAACLGKQRQGAGAKGEAQQHAGLPSDEHHAHHAKQASAHHHQPHHRATPKANQEGGLDALGGGLSRPGIGQGGYKDADFPRDGGKHGAGDVGDGHGEVLADVVPRRPNEPRQEQKDQHSQHPRECRQNGVFLAHKGVRPVPDEPGDALNGLVLVLLLLDPQRQIHRIGEGQNHRKKTDHINKGVAGSHE